MYICSKIDVVGKHFQFTLIRSYSKMPQLPTLCITGKLHNVFSDERQDVQKSSFKEKRQSEQTSEQFSLL